MLQEINGIMCDTDRDAIPQDYFKLDPDGETVHVLSYGAGPNVALGFAEYEGEPAVMMLCQMPYDEFAQRWQDRRYGLINHVLDGYAPRYRPVFYTDDDPAFAYYWDILASDDDVEGEEWFCEDADWRP